MAQRSLRWNGSGLTGRISQGTQGRDSASRSWEHPFLMPLNSSWLLGGLETLEQTIGISGKPWLKCETLGELGVQNEKKPALEESTI